MKKRDVFVGEVVAPSRAMMAEVDLDLYPIPFYGKLEICDYSEDGDMTERTLWAPMIVLDGKLQPASEVPGFKGVRCP